MVLRTDGPIGLVLGTAYVLTHGFWWFMLANIIFNRGVPRQHMDSQTYFGHCYCGKVRFEASGPIRNLCVCHCESCRRAAGAAFVAWGTVSADHFRILSGETSVVRTSADVERTFCANCGSSLTYCHTLRAGELDFTLVSLDTPLALAPQMHIWVQDKLPWIELSDGLPQFQTVPGQGST